MKDKKKQIIWFVVFIALVGVTLLTIVKSNESFSFEGFISYVSSASWQWILLAFICMVGFIVFEAMALLVISRAFGYQNNFRRGVVYSAADIYFSAITPSATGGQPASAYCMMKDKIPGAVTTIILLINLTLYTIAIIVIGVICFLLKPGLFLKCSPFAKVMISIGFGLQFVLIIVFLLLVYREKIVMKIASVGMKVLHKFHLLHDIEKKQKHLEEVEQQYKECARAIKNHKKPLFWALLLNILQRLSLIMVSVCVYIAVGGNFSKIVDAFALQGFVVLGSNSVPIPGAVGVADYLFINGFGNIIRDPVSIELLSRGVSFYCCIIICGILTMAVYLLEGLKGMKRKKNDRSL